jgi:hypothetical protein
MDDCVFDPRWLLESNPNPVRLSVPLTGMPTILLRTVIRANPSAIDEVIGSVTPKFRISDCYCTCSRAGDVGAGIAAQASCNYEYSKNEGTKGNADGFGYGYPAQTQAH